MAQPRAAGAARVIQRAQAVQFHNLTLLSRIDYNAHTGEGGKGLVNGSKIPHANQHFNFGAGDTTYNVDSWTNRVGDLASTIRSGMITMGMTRTSIKNALKHWDMSSSVFNIVLDAFILDSTNPANWVKPNENAGANITLQLKNGIDLANAHVRTLVMHMISMAATSYWRVQTMKTFSGSIRYTDTNTNTRVVTDVMKPINIDNVIEAARGVVKTKLREHKAPPVKPPSIAESGVVIDKLIGTFLEKEAGFADMIDKGMLDPEGIAGYEVKPEKRVGLHKYALETTPESIYQFLNHVRFLMYTEWRGISELP